MRASLAGAEDVASLLIRTVSSTAIVEFLDIGAEKPLAAGNLKAMLADLRNRIIAASRASALADSEGRTRAGRGRALPHPTISAQTYCALLIAETWLYFRDVYPPPRNRQAAEAADIYWGLLGAERRTWGHDKLIPWRSHFQEAGHDQSPKMAELRTEYQRHLRKSARMGAFLSEGSDKDGN